MHDDEQIARLYDLNQALSEGQFPPRISPNLGFGYGYPFFNFYPSFAYLLLPSKIGLYICKQKINSLFMLSLMRNF